VTEAGHPDWDENGFSICHTPIAATGRRVLQYPPGPGFMLAMFPEGHQVVPYYAVATILVLLMAFVAIGLARSRATVLCAAAFSCIALYFMINPAKASYSIAPTMVICAAAGFLTAKLSEFGEQREKLLVAALTGLLLGLAVNFRIPNLLLWAGYCGFFLVAFIAARDARSFALGALFGTACFIGLTPTLIANAVNAGSPFATTYGGGDLAPPDFTFSSARAYLGDLQGTLVIASIAWVASILLTPRARGLRPLALIVAANLVVNLGYFLTHPVFTQYYLMPFAMLSLWSLLFGYVLDDRARHATKTAFESTGSSPRHGRASSTS
jgi:hypothetical protein